MENATDGEAGDLQRHDQGPRPPPTVLILPGLGGSGPQHWQSRWQARHPEFVRVEQASWAEPRLEEWAQALEREVRRHQRVVLVAHSLACQLVAHWARAGSVGRVASALLVAPADVERPGASAEVRSFAPLARERLPFRTWIVASSDDPHATVARSLVMAEAWGARLIEAGPLGHINTASGHGEWPDGEAFLAAILRCGAGARARSEADPGALAHPL
ncbi:MAG: alpha/beta hydrolase [Anaeromyxobacter sp.]